jgi:hypothetical protein
MAVVAHENGGADNPEDTELTSSPNTTDAITDQESTVAREASI